MFLTIQWKVDDAIYLLLQTYGEVDMFASRLKYQTTPYVAWRAEPYAMAMDAFTLIWNYFLIYAFPPFSLIAPVLQKIQMDLSEEIMVVPQWTAQP